jgi:hypothetical protein
MTATLTDTQTPRLQCPPGAIDCRVHPFGPVTQYPFDPDNTVFG